MKKDRNQRILELINERDIETQEELAKILQDEGYKITQATVSRDIRKLHVTKIPKSNGGQKYAFVKGNASHSDRYVEILKEAVIDVTPAQNLVVLKTVSGMAMAAAAALDDMHISEIIGCIAGDDTVLIITKTNKHAGIIVKEIKEFIY